MTDLQSTLDAIDALEQLCGTCDTPLGPDAPSRYWCSPECAEVWNADRCEPLVGYSELRDTALTVRVDTEAIGAALRGMTVEEAAETVRHGLSRLVQSHMTFWSSSGRRIDPRGSR